MNSQKFTEQQLKDLVAGKEVVTCESVKEGDKLYDWCEPVEVCIIDEKTGAERMFSVGDIVQATNEKGEKQWFCPTCKIIEKKVKFENVYQHCPNFDCKGHKGK